MRNSRKSTALLSPAAALAAFAVFGAPPAIAGSVGQRTGYSIVKLDQAPPSVENVQPEPGRPGQTTYYEAELSRSGKPYGQLHGSTVITDVTPDPSGLEELRLRTLVFELPEGQLVAIGASKYDLLPVGNVPALRTAATIAIVGGTGNYAAARGQVTTKRKADGSYEHVLMILN